MGVGNIIFILILIGAIWFFSRNVSKIRRNINLGRDVKMTDHRSQRWNTMFRVAIGQSKMVVRPLAGIMHILIYGGFIIINIEVLEIIIDGIFGTHRVLSFMGGFYDFLIGSFEILALLVIIACVVFLVRREVGRLKRFWNPEMKGWPRTDADLILIIELSLMIAFLTLNASDFVLQSRGIADYSQAGAFPISGTLLGPWFSNLSTGTLEIVERAAWWYHIVGILAFLNYLPYSKHFHILLAFPNVWYSRLQLKGDFNNLESVKKEVELMMDPNADPYAAPADDAPPPERFGAKDVQDLTWKNIMDSYTCTECGRCTSVCPANITGKKLSPRRIMMATRDRAEEVGKNIDKKGREEGFNDGKSLLYDYISEEELWACTTCNACVDACPVNINPLEIIVDLRRFLVMEESKVPQDLTAMFNNVENNGAPWAFPQADRLKWAQED